MNIYVGKTFTACATLKRAVEKHGVTDILMIARTARDMHSTIVPMLLSFYAEEDPNKPKWSPGTSKIIWPSGAIALCVAAEAGENAVRGLNTQLVIADEMGFYENNDGIIDMALLTLRRPPSKFIGLTSPHATQRLIEWVQRVRDGDETIKIITGSTYDNAENLSAAFRDTIISKYENTSLAAAELHGELVLENPSALFQMATVDRNRVDPTALPKMVEYSIGVDPSVMSKKSNVGKKTGRKPDNCGLVVSGTGEDGYFYALDNFSGSYSVEGWVLKVIELYDYYKQLGTTTITLEINTLGEELLKDLFKRVNRLDVHSRVKATFSTQNKLVRLQPYALMAEQDKIKFVNKKSMTPLYTELTTYDGTGRSPDIADAWGFSMTHLSPMRKSHTTTQEFLI